MANHPSSPIEHLPVEILDRIFDDLASLLHHRNANDPAYKIAKGWLANCQSTSRAFRARARPRLFQHICIYAHLDFPLKQAHRLLGLGDEPSGSALREIRTFSFYQLPDSLGSEPVGLPEQNLIGSIIHKLLYLAAHHEGRLQDVEIRVYCGGWEKIGQRLRSAIVATCSHQSPVRRLKLTEMNDLPMTLFQMAAPTTLVLRQSSIQHATDKQNTVALDTSPLAQDSGIDTALIRSRPVRRLHLTRFGDKYRPLDFSLVRAWGTELDLLEITVESAYSYEYNRDDPVLHTVGSLSSPSNATGPQFPKLKTLWVGGRAIYCKPSYSFSDFKAYYLTILELRNCLDLLETFLVKVPIHDTPLLEDVRIEIRASMSWLVEQERHEHPECKGWMMKEWEEFDERLCGILKRHSESPKALSLRVSVVFQFETLIIHRCGEDKPVHLCPETLWADHGYPRADLRRLLPSTSSAFLGSLSLVEKYIISHHFYPF